METYYSTNFSEARIPQTELNKIQYMSDKFTFVKGDELIEGTLMNTLKRPGENVLVCTVKPNDSDDVKTIKIVDNDWKVFKMDVVNDMIRQDGKRAVELDVLRKKNGLTEDLFSEISSFARKPGMVERPFPHVGGIKKMRRRTLKIKSRRSKSRKSRR
jgi:hypothetical protein